MPIHEDLLYMGEEKWQEARIDIIRKYYVELYGEEPHQTHMKENQMGRKGERRVFKKLDTCMEIFNRSLRRPQANKRKCTWLELKEWTKQEKYFFESLVFKHAIEGRLPTRLVRNIDLDASMEEETGIKNELNSECLMVKEEKNSCAENNLESLPATRTN